MKPWAIRRVFWVTTFISCLAVFFSLFFQINKGDPFRDINPFRIDPYDAVGSFAVEAALLLGLLNFARAVRLRGDPAQAGKLRLIMRGNIILLLAVLAAVAADITAVFLNPIPASLWGTLLQAQLAIMAVLMLAGAAGATAVFRPISSAVPPPDLTPADALEDILALVRVPIAWAGGILPRKFVGWVNEFNSDRLFLWIPWVNPRLHPWRFAVFTGLLAGMGLFMAQLREGLPPDLGTGLLLFGIFLGAELSATLIGFAVLGGYLGLRPKIFIVR